MSTIQLDYKKSVFSGRMVEIYGYDNTEWNVVTLQDRRGNLKKILLHTRRISKPIDERIYRTFFLRF
jgi:hypothetical protein